MKRLKVFILALIVGGVTATSAFADTNHADVHNFNGGVSTKGLSLTDIDAAVAAAGATQGAATALTKTVNVVTTGTATSADGVQLPAAVAGKVVIIAAEYGAALAVWPATGDAIDDTAANGEVAQADNTLAIYVAQDATTWRKLEN